jgi:GST-like protein
VNPTMELHGANTGNCLRVSVALEEAAIPYKVVLLDLAAGEHQGPAHLALNPSGKVPTLVDRSIEGKALVISQSNAILLYLAELRPGRLLPADDRVQRALAYERYLHFVTDIIAPSFFAYALKKHDVDSAGAAELEAIVIQNLIAADRFVAASPFMAGDRFSLADIAAYTIALPFKSRIARDAAPNFWRWFEEMQARPAVRRGLAAFARPPA